MTGQARYKGLAPFPGSWMTLKSCVHVRVPHGINGGLLGHCVTAKYLLLLSPASFISP